jgi:uncharacterized membrane protein
MEHILEYFVGGGYNLVNTTVYAAVVFLGYYLFYKAIKKYVPFCRIDKHFLWGVLVFVFLGALLRILEQNYTGVWLIESSNSPLKIGFYFHTPGWLILLSFVFLVSFLLSIILFKEKYYKLLIPIGVCLSLPLLVYEILHIKHLLVLLVTLLAITIIYFIIQFFVKFKTLEDKLVILSQVTDFSATLSGIFFFSNLLYEQHPLSRAVIGYFPILYPLLKLFFAFLFIFIVNKAIKDSEERLYTKLLIIILGFLTGTRDLLTISLLV